MQGRVFFPICYLLGVVLFRCCTNGNRFIEYYKRNFGELTRQPSIYQLGCSFFFTTVIWISYRAFTRTYAKLAAKLYRDFKARAHGEENETINRIEEKTRVIPKRLFEAACNKLMPLRASVTIPCFEVNCHSDWHPYPFNTYGNTRRQ